MTNEQIVEKIRNGYSVTENMRKLYEGNLPMIKHFIKPYVAYENEEDLLQESYFGLWEAVQHYETSENVLFMTYARFWIRQSVSHYIEKCGSLVRIPNHARQKLTRYNKIVQNMIQEQGKTPTDDEIAGKMQLSVLEVKRLRVYSQSISSLDKPLKEESDSTLGESIQADYNLEDTALDKIYAEHSQKELWDIVKRYTAEREDYIIREYFLHNKSMTEIAKEQNVTPSRIREIKENALRKLRCDNAKRDLCNEFEVAECSLYRNGVNKYNEHKFTSTVEYIALRKAEIQERYEKRMREFIA